MIVALDVGYTDVAESTVGVCGVVGFEHWDSAEPAAEFSVLLAEVAPYVSGRFFERELPCLHAGLSRLADCDASVEVVIVDGHVRLDQEGTPGLGMYLFDALGGSIPVVGVAKKGFHSLRAVEVLRGTSSKPLHVTAAGMDELTAATRVGSMAGPYRLPTMLRKADALSRRDH